MDLREKEKLNMERGGEENPLNFHSPYMADSLPFGFLPPTRPQFPDDPGFIERAARFSSFNGFYPNSFGASDPGSNGGEASQSGGEPELSSEKTGEDPARTARKRKRGSLDQETDQARADSSKEAGKVVVDEAPKEDYIHVRARRGQATNSHSLAERLRREKISERMKFLQDLVPGCSKVTGKAVMLDEIINYVQSLQRQVEFLSMKLATVNPRLDFNIESILSKEMLQSRGASCSSFEFVPEMGHHPQMHPHQSLIHSGIPGLGNPSDVHRRSINAQLASTQMPGVWDEELHHVLQMGFGGSAPLSVHDLHGFSTLGQMKSEP